MKRRATTTAVLVLAAAAAAACDRGEPGAMPVPGEVASVTVSSPATGAAPLQLPGTVRSTDEVEVATRHTGRLDRLAVHVGSRVSRGDTLALVDPSGVRSRIDAAEAEAERARAYWRRIRALERDGAATPQELDDAVARKESAEAGLREARARMSYAAIVAPFDGMIAARLSDPGDLVVAGRPIVTLVRPGSLKAVADVPASLADRLSVGSSVPLRATGGERALGARVARVAPAVDPASHRVRVELVFDDPGSRELPPPGAFVRLEMEDPSAAGLWIPADALVSRGQLTGVYLLREGALELRWIRTGARRGDAVEVLAGIGPDDVVVRSPEDRLADGVRVASAERAAWTP